MWELAGKRGDNAWTSVESAYNKNGCWEITGCGRTEGAKVGTTYGCKPVPKPGYTNDCDANGAWIAQKNGTITSAMDGHCLTLGADKASLEVSSCSPGDKSQQWVFDPKWTHSGSGKPTTVRSAVDASAEDGSPSAAGICIDNGPVSPDDEAPAPAAASCELYSSVTAVKGNGKSILGGVHPSGSYEEGRGCAATLKAADGRFLWSSPSFGSASATLNGPAPSLVSNSTVLALLDAPRFVPPPWGATPVPPYVNAASLPHANTSGYDLTNHADDLYLFISADNHAAGLAGIRAEYLALSGHIPLLPPWAFGLWFTWCVSARCPPPHPAAAASAVPE